MQRTESTPRLTSRIARHTLIVTALLIVSGMLSGCVNPDWRALQQARLLWEANNIYSYSYDLQVVCFCIDDVTRPVRIVVQNDQAVSIEYIDNVDAKEDAPPELFEAYDTIDDLFDLIETRVMGSPASVEIEYNDDFGYPASVFIDESLQIADEEIGWTVENLVPFRISP